MSKKNILQLITALFVASFLLSSCASNQKGMKVKSTNKMYKGKDI